MEFSFGILALIAITFAAAIVNGAIGYGFSSLTVPVGLLFFTNRLLNPSLVLIELIINIYVLIIERIGNSFASGPRKLRRSRGCSLPLARASCHDRHLPPARASYSGLMANNDHPRVVPDA